MNEPKPTESKVSLFFRMLCALPMFLVLTVIFWELVLGAWLLSRWFYDHGWNFLGASARVVWILLAGVTIYLTIMVFAGWVVGLIQIIRGSKSLNVASKPDLPLRDARCLAGDDERIHQGRHRDAAPGNRGDADGK
jgi:hypothetical protein